MGMGSRAARGGTRGTGPSAGSTAGTGRDGTAGAGGSSGAAARSVLGEAPEQLCWALHRLPQAQGALVGLSCEREVERRGRRGAEAGLPLPPSPPGLLSPNVMGKERSM